jgi:hypothetical protein
MRPHLSSTRILPLVLGLPLAGLFPHPSAAVPPIGFVEHWPGTSLQGWGGGSQTYENPGTGGVGGAGDGYLRMGNSLTAYHLGTVNLDAMYAGDWPAAGLTHLKVSLNDVGTDDNLAIHFLIANAYTTYQYNPPFNPPHNQWAEFTVDLTNPGAFTRIIGSGNFPETLASVDRVHFRHDLAPYTHGPDLILGDVGIDRLIIGNATTPAQTTSWGRIKSLYRK